jgi:CotS family spore coat protein
LEENALNDYQIVPWNHLADPASPDLVLEQYVPPELEALAKKVLEFYDLPVSRMQLITSKPDKGGAIWKLETEKGPYSLKVLHRLPQRSLFSIGAQDYLVRQGARVPALIPTKDNQLYVEAGGKLWIVTDWIEPLQPVSKVDLEGAEALCYGLGEFHRLSKGYVPPFGASISSRTGGWFKYYDKLITKIGWFEHIASAYPETVSSKQLLSVNGEFERQARDALARLQQSSYSRMAAKGNPHWGLVHQDYGWSNGQMGPGGIWVIDLDGVSYDLPIRDLRKLITSTMDDMGTWDIAWIRGMIAAYHKANPIDRQTFEVLLIDMAFPNEFYKHVKEIVFDPVLFMNTELEPILQRCLATEATKWETLDLLAKDSANYPEGDYSAAEESAAKFQLPVPSLPNAGLQHSGSKDDQRETGSGAEQDAALPDRFPAADQPIPQMPHFKNSPKRLRKTKRTQQAKLAKHAKPIKQIKQIKPKQAKQAKQIKQVKHIKKAKQAKEATGAKAVKQAKQIKQIKQIKQAKRTKQVKQTKPTQRRKKTATSKRKLIISPRFRSGRRAV